MKNKKLFAILTLVCFMFTLMPVAAFAAEEPKTKVIADGIAVDYFGNYATVNVPVETKDTTGTAYVYAHQSPARLVGQATVPAGATDVDVIVDLGDLKEGDSLTAVQAFTKAAQPTKEDVEAAAVGGEAVVAGFERVAALANADAKNDRSAIVLADDEDASVTANQAKTAGVELKIFALDRNDEAAAFNAGELYIWAVDADGITSALTVDGDWSEYTGVISDMYVNNAAVANGDSVTVKFARPGQYTVYAGYGVIVNKIADIERLNARGVEPVEITVRGTSVDPNTFVASMNGGVDVVAGNTLGVLPIVTPNNVFATDVEVAFAYADGKALIGKNVTIETNSSSIEVSKATDKTDAFGLIDFEVAASVEGDYEIDLTVDGVTWTIKVSVGNTAAAYIKAEKQPAYPQALYSNWANDKVEFVITDINGNTVMDNNTADTILPNGMQGIEGNAADGLYVVLTEKPAASNLESENLGLVYNSVDGVWGLTGVGNLDAEGKYAVKVILDNGAYATAEWTVKPFGTPVRLLISETPDSVELGAQFNPILVLMDANGVTKSAGSAATLAATGYALADLSGNYVTVKTDEKYAGSVIKLTAVSEKYDLVATKDVKVAAEAVAIDFEDVALDVNVNNKVDWFVVDAEGNKVSLASKYATGVTADVKYVVLDKPEGAKVSVTGSNAIANFKGAGEMALTTNKVGNITVQVIAKVKVGSGSDSTVANQVKYYTGTQVFAVGTDKVGDVVVMSIGSNQIVKNDVVATMVAAPIVKDARTFVPFRALSEAFGAEVAWDDATHTVTAELNGAKVVLTIGANAYKVNGVEKTADVAPFINGASTMVPVRFVAEAFGINVIPTYDNNGATADILFNL